MRKISCDHERREAERRFVEHEQARSHEQRAADGQHLLLAARQRARLLAPPLGEAREIAEHPVEVLPDRRSVGADVRSEPQVLFDGQIGEGAASVGHMRDAEARDRLRRQRADRPAAQPYLALAANEAGEGAQRGRLAGAVRAEEGGRAAVLDCEVEAEQRLDRPVEGRKVLHLEDRPAHAAVPR